MWDFGKNGLSTGSFVENTNRKETITWPWVPSTKATAGENIFAFQCYSTHGISFSRFLDGVFNPENRSYVKVLKKIIILGKREDS